ncbi:MAG: class I SAM-dependent methyltransferase, partial [Halioglobus sp.]|nr:class I SAM-dependent methyltransferase [Halioglobus sp.]
MTAPPRADLSLAVAAAGPGDVPLASALARQLGAVLAPTGTDPANCENFAVLLVVSDEVFALRQTPALTAGAPPGANKRHAGRPAAGRALPGPVTVEFGSDAMRHRRRSGHTELLGRAVGIGGGRHPRVLDATAGLGRDSFVLADMGCAVTLCEREPVLAAMLAQGLQLALARGDAWQRQVVQRMRLFPGDARDPAALPEGPADVIYLDPRF